MCYFLCLRRLRGTEMQFRKITTEDAAFLAEIFSVPEYALYGP